MRLVAVVMLPVRVRQHRRTRRLRPRRAVTARLAPRRRAARLGREVLLGRAARVALLGPEDRLGLQLRVGLRLRMGRLLLAALAALLRAVRAPWGKLTEHLRVRGAVVQWQNICFPSRQRGFDSRQPLRCERDAAIGRVPFAFVRLPS